MISHNDPRVDLLFGGRRLWWDMEEKKLVPAMTVYLPQGCPDWGAPNGRRNHNRCIFCAGETAVAGFRQEFYNGNVVPFQDHLFLLKAVFAKHYQGEHTVFIFNAGSFFAELANPQWLQKAILENIAKMPLIKRIVVDARAAVITEPAISQAADILFAAKKKLTVRIGIETQDDHLRLKILKKGHTRTQLHQAAKVMREHKVQSGGYILLNPAPNLPPDYARKEALSTFDFVLEELALSEAYFCSANVAPDSPLATAWAENKFAPADLWSVWWTLKSAVQKYPNRVHMLPFADEPEFLSVPSNHTPRGIPQNLQGAQGCDLAFHQLLEHYRQTMNINGLSTPNCHCRPSWF